MARGWESKSVEAQIEDKKTEKAPISRSSDRESESSRKRASLEMSQRRVARELETASSDIHRSALKNALDYLNKEIDALSRK